MRIKRLLALSVFPMLVVACKGTFDSKKSVDSDAVSSVSQRTLCSLAQQAINVAEDLRFIIDEEGIRSRQEGGESLAQWFSGYRHDIVLDVAGGLADRLVGRGRVDLESLTFKSPACVLPKRYKPKNVNQFGAIWAVSLQRPWSISAIEAEDFSATDYRGLNYEFIGYSEASSGGELRSFEWCYHTRDRTLFPIWERTAMYSTSGEVEYVIIETGGGEDHVSARRHGPAFRGPCLGKRPLWSDQVMGYIELERKFDTEVGAGIYAELLSDDGRAMTQEIFWDGGPPSFFWVDRDPNEELEEYEAMRQDITFAYHYIDANLLQENAADRNESSVVKSRRTTRSLGSHTFRGGFYGMAGDVNIFIYQDAFVVEWNSAGDGGEISKNKYILTNGGADYIRTSLGGDQVHAFIAMDLDSDGRVSRCALYGQSKTRPGAVIPVLQYVVDQSSGFYVKWERRLGADDSSVTVDIDRGLIVEDGHFRKAGELAWVLVYRLKS